MRKLITLSISCVLLTLASCHKEGNLILNDNFSSIGNWQLNADTTTSASIENSMLQLTSSTSYVNLANARLMFSVADAKKVCFEIHFNKFSSDISEDWHSGDKMYIQVGDLLLQKTTNGVPYGEETEETHFSMDDQVVHFEINIKKKTFKVKSGSKKVDISDHFILQNSPSSQSYIEFETSASSLSSFPIATPTEIKLNSIKIYTLR